MQLKCQSKVKSSPCARHGGIWGSASTAPHILDLGNYMKLSGQLHVPAALLPGPIGTGSWVGPRACMDD
jgi:hypothetical protein